MKLTVGSIEDKLRKYPKGTEVHLSCGCCHHSSSGEESILGVDDRTNQTFGYIELNFNNSCKAEVELSSDKEDFYKKEIVKLLEENNDLNNRLNRYKDFIKSLKSNIEWVSTY